MTTKTKKFLKIAGFILLGGLLIGLGVGYYMYNMPHRDIQDTATDFHLSVTELVNEYLNDPEAANKRYLAEDGNSKILEINGTVLRSRKNMNNQLMVVLQNPDDAAGANITFTPEASINAPQLEPGQMVSIKGVIRSGVYYDENLDMYVNAVIDHAALVLQQE